MQPPLVDLLVPKSPPQSLSVYASIDVGGSCQRNTDTHRGNITKYLPSLFNATRSHFAGLLIYFEISLLA
jgi:hypothetical protein